MAGRPGWADKEWLPTCWACTKGVRPQRAAAGPCHSCPCPFLLALLAAHTGLCLAGAGLAWAAAFTSLPAERRSSSHRQEVTWVLCCSCLAVWPHPACFGQTPSSCGVCFLHHQPGMACPLSCAGDLLWSMAGLCRLPSLGWLLGERCNLASLEEKQEATVDSAAHVSFGPWL